MAFRTYTENGELAGANYPHFIYVYPNGYEEDGDLLREACSAAAKMCNQLKEYGAIDYYRVYEYNEDESDHYYPYADESDSHSFKSDFNDWWSGKYNDRQGCHVCIGADAGGGKADPGDEVDTSAFSSASDAVAGFSEVSGGRATVAHECLHSMIIKDTVVGYESDDLAPSNEHELGRVYRTGEVSPFANNHSDDASPAGDCSLDELEQDEIVDLTRCTKEGVYRTTRKVY